MAKPSMIRIGTHHYVRLSESSPEDFGYTQEDLESIEIVAPFGGAVPQSCEQSIKKMFKKTRMSFSGLKKEQDRADVIAYLLTLQ